MFKVKKPILGMLPDTAEAFQRKDIPNLSKVNRVRTWAF